MEAVFDEAMIREELRRLDRKTGLHAADLPIRFGNARSYLGMFSYVNDEALSFYFSNRYFRDPTHPVEEKLDTIRHEYAHYMDYMLNGSSSHGLSWKRCCQIVGAFPSRCFSRKRAEAFVAKHERERLANEAYDRYTVGCAIRHPTFGSGTVTDIKGEGLNRMACVRFEDVGQKTIALSWLEANSPRD